MRLPIPQAMKWKYDAKCGKTPEGDDIAVWEHPTILQPSKAQVAIDVAEYEAYIVSAQAEDDRREKEFNNMELTKAVARAMREYVNELRVLLSQPEITNEQLKAKVKSYMG